MNFNELTTQLSDVAPTWQGVGRAKLLAQPSGFLSLDEMLPGGGWPLGGLIELVPAQTGIGEVRLTLPALCEMCRMKRRVAFVCPPFPPDPPALHGRGLPLSLTIWIAAKTDEEGLWAAAQLLRENSTGAVLLWSRCRSERSLRKLQLSAEAGKSLAFLFREPQALKSPSPAALRLELRPAKHALQVEIHKSRGGRPGVVSVRMPKIRI